MIRRLTQHDHELCFNLLKTRPAENLFLIGDIEAYGYEQDFQKLWGDFNEKGELIAVLLKYYENYIPFSVEGFHAKGFAQIISEDKACKMMSGLKEVTEQIEPYLQKVVKRKRQTFYAKCTELQVENNIADTIEVKKAEPNDAEKIVELLDSIPEFTDSTNSVDRLRRALENNTSRSFFVKNDNKLVSIASTTAENSLSAMVVGVGTLEDYKKKGYATACVLEVCKELLGEGKELCLFYDNPSAGAIYKRIGFIDIGYWMMYSFD